MPHQPFRFAAYPEVKPSQPAPRQQSLTPEVLRGQQPTQPPAAELDPIRVPPTPRLRTDDKTRTDNQPRMGAIGMVPKASMIPRSSPKTWQQTPSPPAEQP